MDISVILSLKEAPCLDTNSIGLLSKELNSVSRLIKSNLVWAVKIVTVWAPRLCFMISEMRVQLWLLLAPNYLEKICSMWRTMERLFSQVRCYVAFKAFERKIVFFLCLKWLRWLEVFIFLMKGRNRAVNLGLQLLKNFLLQWKPSLEFFFVLLHLL